MELAGYLETLVANYQTIRNLSQKKKTVIYICNTPPITVAAKSNAWNVFAHSNTGVQSSHPTRGMDVYVCVLFCIYVAALRRAEPPGQGFLPTVYRLRTWKSDQGPTKGCRAITEENSNTLLWAYLQCSSLHEYCRDFSHAEIHRAFLASDSYPCFLFGSSRVSSAYGARLPWLLFFVVFLAFCRQTPK
jgi:hypothetical protein